MYEVVWTRLFITVFGSATQSVVAAVAAVFLGMALGSLAAGRIGDRLTSRHALRWYAFAELGVGIGAVLSLLLIPQLFHIFRLVSDGTQQTVGLTALKMLLAFCAVLLSTVLMGATLPLLVRALSAVMADSEKRVSTLYMINTFGAAAGVLLAGFILFELIGLTGTLLVAAGGNVLVACVALSISRGVFPTEQGEEPLQQRQPLPPRSWVILAVFAISGFIALGYQVLWTRLLTPRMGTFVYAFSMILMFYLVGIAVGSALYSRMVDRRHSPLRIFIFSQIGIGISAVISVAVLSANTLIPSFVSALVVLFPATLCMGIAFPALIGVLRNDSSSTHDVGRAYSMNTLGAVLGLFVVTFGFLTTAGSIRSVLIFAPANIVLVFLVLFARKGAVRMTQRSTVSLTILFLTLIGIALWLHPVEWFTGKVITYAQERGYAVETREDPVASVVAFGGTNGEHGLVLDGVGTTAIVAETKMMAHLPVALHPDPHNMLIVAFGMGTTFRSALIHDALSVDDVELSPSVPKMFPLFYSDAQEVLANPRGKVVINDGRNYVRLTDKRYDVVTIDPPPPFNAAGTTVLYSKEFYQDITQILRPGGIVSQWLYFDTKQDDIAMAVKSFIDVFPYVSAFGSPRGYGVYLIGSERPIEIRDDRVSAVFGQDRVIADFAEVGVSVTPDMIKSFQLGDRQQLEVFSRDSRPVTDMAPRTEYFLLRVFFHPSPFMDPQLLQSP